MALEGALRGEIGMGFPSPDLERRLSNEPPDIGPLEGSAGLYVNGEYFVGLRAVENGLVYVAQGPNRRQKPEKGWMKYQRKTPGGREISIMRMTQ